jgi:hypothetical protein
MNCSILSDLPISDQGKYFIDGGFMPSSSIKYKYLISCWYGYQ